MDRLAPVGPVYQAGTLSGNPLACAAGAATLKVLMSQNPYARLESLSSRLESGMRRNLAGFPQAWTLNRVGSLMTLFFGKDRVESYAQVKDCDAGAYGLYHAGMLALGHYLAPSAFEALFVSAAHTEADVDSFLAAQAAALSGKAPQ